MQVTLEEQVRNPLKEKLAAGQVVLSLILRVSRGPEIAAIAANAGFDTLYVDLEHSVLSLETTSLLCYASRTSGLVPLVRIPATDAALIARLLDAGAMGIIAPHICCAEEARHVVTCAKYPPEGTRSVATGLPLLNYRTFPPSMANPLVNASTFVAVMIESQSALDNIEDIAAVEGVDMLFIGAGDLSTDLGIPGQWDEPKMRDAFMSIQDAATRHCKHVGIGGLAGQPDLLQELIEKGARFLSLGTDLGLLSTALEEKAKSGRDLFNKKEDQS